ncbi:hypothetical protein NIES4071_59060 [Calothrix sp. NIES-4071]|nr:hypothetical protein NIES4071_59060 [Calothrix sp. NIES-4071]BAZ60213.1 hypothetical protein NIES4105_59010 [Calothrix sp. NIES-4105]
MLREIDNNLWVAEQPFKYWGLEVGARMTVIRLISGELIVISPIQTGWCYWFKLTSSTKLRHYN